VSGAAFPGRLHGMLMLGVTTLCWGLNWPVLKFAVGEWPPFTFRLLSGLAGCALMFGLALLRQERLRPPPGQWGRLAVAAILNITSFMGFATVALLWLDASEVAIIVYTMPLWAAIMAWPVLGERPNAARAAGLAIGFGGIAMLMAGQLVSAPVAALAAKLPGVGFILATALMFAAGAVFTKRFPNTLPPAANLAWQILIGSLPLCVIAVLFDRWDLSHVTPLGWGALAYVAVAATCVSYVAWFRALRVLPASTAAIGTLLVPVVGVVSSAFALGEPLGPRQFMALGMTIGGVVLASRA
jgi:drug/metabolite transporter (DMT)-like permease